MDLSNITDAIEAGVVHAHFELGMKYLKGEGIDKDLSKGLPLIVQAATRGHARAQLELSEIFAVTEDFESSAEWLGKAVDQGNAEAQFRMGKTFLSTDEDKAVLFMTKAAEQDHADAQFALGAIIGKNANGDTQKLVSSLYWLGKAAEQGNTDALNALENLHNTLVKNK